MFRDHPRGCGENQRSGADAEESAGSPPRMRGKRCADVVNLGSTGITPADAGKTHHCDSRSLAAEDHPRGCGENTKKIL